MKKVSIFIGLCVLLFGISSPLKADADSTTWQKSVNIQPQSPTDFASSSFDTSVDNALADGANYITLVIPVQQATTDSTTISAAPDTPTDAALTSAANYIHAKGASVAFVLHDTVADGTWRAFVNPSDRTAWFASYGAQLNHYAVLAQSLGVQELIIGAEMTDMTLPSVDSTNTANWVALISAVRGEYSGLVTYASQHDGYMEDDESLGFWPELDAIGIDAYYGLGSGDESVATIEANWAQYESEIQNLSTKYNKPVLFTEVGYVSQTNALGDPSSAYQYSYPVDDAVQATAYQALFQYWQKYSFIEGMDIWSWNSNPNAGGANDTDYTPQNKPAEQVMKEFFTTNAIPSYTATSTAGANPNPNTATTLTSTVSAPYTETGMIVDVEVYNSGGQQVSQSFYSNQTLGTTSSTYTSSFTPGVVGTYSIRIGVFSANWQTNPYWNASAGSIVVAAPVATAPATTSTPPPTYPSTIDVWWPSNGSWMSGTQPFQATLDGVDPATYNMYWKVDGGQLNPMTTNMSPVAHKLAEVDLSGWNWNPNGQYTVTFVAQDPAGDVLAVQSETIHVSH